MLKIQVTMHGKSNDTKTILSEANSIEWGYIFATETVLSEANSDELIEHHDDNRKW